MKRSFIVLAALFCGSAPAMAADDGDLAGFYAGLQGGYSWGDAPQPYGNPASTTTFPYYQAGAQQSGGTVGIYTGYNLQRGPLLLGLEGDINLDRADGNDGRSGGDVNGVKHRWSANIRGRVGYVVGGGTAVYAAGGVAFLNAKATNLSRTPAEEIDTSWTGWTLGAGVEHAFSRRISARIEYRYADYGDRVARFTTSGYAELINPKINTVQAGVAYRF
ncbi:MAG: porin family protein [Novosphingobium sp.]